jgi:hypothetical protein
MSVGGLGTTSTVGPDDSPSALSRSVVVRQISGTSGNTSTERISAQV